MPFPCFTQLPSKVSFLAFVLVALYISLPCYATRDQIKTFVELEELFISSYFREVPLVFAYFIKGFTNQLESGISYMDLVT